MAPEALQATRSPRLYDLAVCVLASGSKGNAIYISDGQTSILLDAGLSGVEIERRLAVRGLRPDDLDAIIVSHEHADHIRGVGILSRRYRLPVYINPATARAAPQLGRLHEIRSFACGRRFHVRQLSIRPFSISHDARDPAGFIFTQSGVSIGIATDLGVATTLVAEHLKGCRLLILEANHDPEMLETGPYPWPLKQRIKSRAGHLSNQESKTLLEQLQHKHLQHVILAHLSENNNTPEKAFHEVAAALTRCDACLSVAAQHTSGPIIYLK